MVPLAKLLTLLALAHASANCNGTDTCVSDETSLLQAKQVVKQGSERIQVEEVATQEGEPISLEDVHANSLAQAEFRELASDEKMEWYTCNSAKPKCNSKACPQAKERYRGSTTSGQGVQEVFSQANQGINVQQTETQVYKEQLMKPYVEFCGPESCCLETYHIKVPLPNYGCLGKWPCCDSTDRFCVGYATYTTRFLRRRKKDSEEDHDKVCESCYQVAEEPNIGDGKPLPLKWVPGPSCTPIANAGEWVQGTGVCTLPGTAEQAKAGQGTSP